MDLEKLFDEKVEKTMERISVKILISLIQQLEEINK